MNDRLQRVSSEEHGPRREMAAFTTSIDCQRAEGRVPVATNSGAGRTRARAKRRLTRNPVLPKKIGLVSLTALVVDRHEYEQRIEKSVRAYHQQLADQDAIMTSKLLEL